jgi:hypothetical protein
MTRERCKKLIFDIGAIQAWEHDRQKQLKVMWLYSAFSGCISLRDMPPESYPKLRYVTRTTQSFHFQLSFEDTDPRPHASCTAEQTLEPGYASKKSKTPPPSPSNTRPSIFRKAPQRARTPQSNRGNAGGYVSGQCQLPKSPVSKKSAPEKKKKRIPFLLSHRHQTRNIVSLLAYARNNARKMDTDTSVPEKE